MAAAARYGPLVPHMLSEIPKRHVGLIGYESPIKGICILPARRRYKSPKHSDGKARFMPSSPHYRSILWALYRLVAGKMHIRLLGASSPNGPGFSTTYAVLGGHFRRRRPWWWCWLFSYDRSEKVLNPPYVVDLNI